MPLPSKSRACVLFLLLLAGCASGPEVKRAITVTPTDSLSVEYQQSSGPTFVLRNALAAMRARAAGERPSANLVGKQIDNEDMQKLLDGLASYDFFQLAAATPHSGGKARLIVDHNGRRHVLSGVLQAGEQFDKFNSCLASFQYVFNRTQEYQSDWVSPALQSEIEKSQGKPTQLERTGATKK